MELVVSEADNVRSVERILTDVLVGNYSFSSKHVGAAIHTQIVCSGGYMPRGRGQTRTIDIKSHKSLINTFLQVLKNHRIDTGMPSDIVYDIKCSVHAEDVPIVDMICVLAEIQDVLREWAVKEGYVLALGLHALETNDNRRKLIAPHLHVVCFDCRDEVVEQIEEFVKTRKDVELICDIILNTDVEAVV